MSKLMAIAALMALSVGVAHAGDRDFSRDFSRDFWDRGDHHCQAPEIDAASTMTAMTLLVGGLAVVRGRSRSRK